jgi:hypothetical protein
MNRRRRFRPFRHLRFLVAEYSEHLGVPLMILGVIALIMIMAIPLLPIGPVEQVQGTITGLGFEEDYGGSFASAAVALEDRSIRVRLPSRHDCRVGDKIQLRQRATRWGYTTGVMLTRWPCSRP